MTDPERVRIDVEGGIADVRLSRGDKHNGLDWRMLVALSDAVDELAANEEVRCVVIAGEGPSFCAGLDFKSFLSEETEGDLSDDAFARREGEEANFVQRTTYGWRKLPMPVIAALHGACFGGGVQLALAADVRIAAPTTRMSVMEVRYGLVPDMALSQGISLIRPDIARELAYTGRVVEADEALEIGLVTRLADDAVAAARELAAEIADKSPDAIRGIKRLAAEAWGKPPAEALPLEAELQRGLLGTPAQLEAVQRTMSGG